MKNVSSSFPQFAMSFMGKQMVAMGGGQTPKVFDGQRRPQSATTASGGNGSQGTSGQQRGARPNIAAGPGIKTPARYMGLPVCWGFNNGECKRLPAGTTAKTCKDATTTFAHVCNFFVRATNKHCFADHMKTGNH